MKAAVYARISKDRDGEALGVARQLADCRALADRLGWEVIEEHVDNDVSAYSGKARPGYQALVDAIARREVDGVLAWHPDRLHRSPRELEGFIDTVEAAGVRVETVTAGTVDLATPTGRAVARTVGAWARHESEHKAERQRRKARELAEAGRVAGGGTRPFGFEADRRTIREDEAALIREAARRVLAGDSLRGIAADWNARGIPTSAGGRWQQQPLRRLLTSSRIAGWRSHRGLDIARAEWPAVVPMETVERLRAILRDPARRTTLPAARRYLLTGLVRCSECGKPLRSRPRADKVRRYVCASGPMFGGCGRVFVVAEPLERYVEEAAVLVLDGPELAAALAAREHGTEPHDAARIADDERALEELARDYYAERRIGRAEYLAARDAVQARIAAARRRLARTGGQPALAAVLGAAARSWPALPFDRKRAVLAALLEAVEVTPGRRGLNRFDSSRVRFAWRA